MYSKYNQRKSELTNNEQNGTTVNRLHDYEDSESFNSNTDDEHENDYMSMMVIDQNVLTTIFNNLVLKQLNDDMSLIRKFPFMQSFGKATFQKVINKLEK